MKAPMMYTSRHQLIKSELIMALTRRPKPPCWRDFIPVTDIKKNKHDRYRYEAVEADLAQILRGGPDNVENAYSRRITNLKPKTDTKSKVPTQKDKKHEKHEKHEKNGHKSKRERDRGVEVKVPKSSKHRLHRTRSSAALKPANLGDLTVTLAEAEAGSMGLTPGKGYTSHSLYEDENRRRCMKWIRSVQASQPLDDVDFLGGSGEELGIPEESSRDLQNVKVSDQYYRETRGDFLDADALKLMEEHAEKKHVKSKSRAHRKVKKYHEKKMAKHENVTDENMDIGAKENKDGAKETKGDIEKEIMTYSTLGATKLAKARYHEYQTVLEDIDELSSIGLSGDAKDECRGNSSDSVTAVMDLPPESSDAAEETTFPIGLGDNSKGRENMLDCRLNCQEETEWEVLCEKLQNYSLDGGELS